MELSLWRLLLQLSFLILLEQSSPEDQKIFYVVHSQQASASTPNQSRKSVEKTSNCVRKRTIVFEIHARQIFLPIGDVPEIIADVLHEFETS